MWLGAPIVATMRGTAPLLARAVLAGLLAVALATGTSACTPTVQPVPAQTLSAPPSGSNVAHEPGWSQPKADPLYPDYGNPELDVIAYKLALIWSPGLDRLTG